MKRKFATIAHLSLVAATLAGLAGCCWMRCPCTRDCHPAKPCNATDCAPRRNIDVNVGAHAGTSGVGLDAGIDRK